MLMQGVTSSCKFKPARRRARVAVLLAVAHVVSSFSSCCETDTNRSSRDRNNPSSCNHPTNVRIGRDSTSSMLRPSELFLSIPSSSKKTLFSASSCQRHRIRIGDIWEREDRGEGVVMVLGVTRWCLHRRSAPGQPIAGSSRLGCARWWSRSWSPGAGIVFMASENIVCRTMLVVPGCHRTNKYPWRDGLLELE
jgi:hypothetical protein